MPPLELLIGNKRYSSWSMRPWLVLAASGLAFEEKLIPFHVPDWQARVGSPSGKVPLLRHGDVVIHESLAIAEYVAELAPDAGLWPADRERRAVARAISTEMHAGFAALRRECPMDTLRRAATWSLSHDARAEATRVQTIWRDCLQKGGGPFLFGRFGIADAMFAPVVTRFLSYGVDISPEVRAYMDAVLAFEPVRAWIDASAAEKDWGGAGGAPTVGPPKDAGDALAFARAWADAWSRRDLEGVLGQYADHVVFSSPKAAPILGTSDVRGKEALRRYWTAALAQTTRLSFEVVGVTLDAPGRTLLVEYTSDTSSGRMRAAETMVFDTMGRIVRGAAYYGAGFP
jgi:glutathione S-transferase